MLCVSLDLGLVVEVRVQGGTGWIHHRWQTQPRTTNALFASECDVCECTVIVFECAGVQYVVGWHNSCVCVGVGGRLDVRVLCA